jgi:hypothetical protein
LRFFYRREIWRVLEAQDCWLMQAALRFVDAVYGTEPEIDTDRGGAFRAGGI